MVIKKQNSHSTHFTFNQLEILFMISFINRVFTINANSVSFKLISEQNSPQIIVDRDSPSHNPTVNSNVFHFGFSINILDEANISMRVLIA